jgi:hypothetical protein
MTQIGDLLQLALAGAFTNGLWAQRAPDKQTPPYGVYTYSGLTDYYLSGKSSDQNVHVQIDIYAMQEGDAQDIADDAETRMVAQSRDASPSMFTSTQLSRQTGPPDPDTRLKRVVLEFSVWYRP